MSYLISFNEAVTFIEQFATHPELIGIAKNDALGGIISKQSIDGDRKLEIAYTGNMAWFCYNYKNEFEKYPKLFLAFEENSNYVKERRVPVPAIEELRCPANTSVFNYDKNTNGSVEDFINSQKGKPQLPVDQIIPKIHVELLKTYYKVFSPLRDLNDHPYGFFENINSNDVIRFLSNPKLKYIRYFFGYSEELKYEKSKLRVILFGVDENGENLIPSNKIEVADDDNVILQKSWPPPPPLTP